MNGQTWLALATIAAILIGPIAAVMVTRYIDGKRTEQQRRMDVFRTLMRTRRLQLSPDHVGALNLVEIEFHGEKDVLSAWRDYLTHLARPHSAHQTPAQQAALTRERDGLLTKLLHAIARSLKFHIEQLEIFEGGYTPQGWADDELQLRALRYFMLEVLRGNSPIPVTLSTGRAPADLFPPPPEVTQQ
jgi:hypothetical protein